MPLATKLHINAHSSNVDNTLTVHFWRLISHYVQHGSKRSILLKMLHKSAVFKRLVNLKVYFQTAIKYQQHNTFSYFTQWVGTRVTLIIIAPEERNIVRKCGATFLCSCWCMVIIFLRIMIAIQNDCKPWFFIFFFRAEFMHVRYWKQMNPTKSGW